ncbi:hypothetical protein [Streptomyces sp. RFCAC02]|uniref:hypothetical protein n=1 Tax=Streptomyces sp. RFCAC02 TaxID=2499143 RepID=UPI0010214ED4|nr:hypothetical protein [Streptomyces sp. RFCAC02]
MNPVFVCGRRAFVPPSFLTVRLRVETTLVRCELAEHPPFQPHFAYAADRPDALPEAVWAVWSDRDPTVRFHVLADCDTGNGQEGAEEHYCTLFEAHPAPCSWAMICLHREVDALMAEFER